MYSPKELFFVQRLLESLDYRTIDSYRVRYLNSLRALEELQTVYRGCIEGRYQQFDNLRLCVEETIYLVRHDDVLRFPIFSKDYFLNLLKKLDKNNFQRQYPSIKTAVGNVIISNEEDYIKRALDALVALLTEEDEDDPFRQQFRTIERLTLLLSTEVLRQGYSKSHAHYLLSKRIFKRGGEDFDTAFDSFKDFMNAKPREYKVILRVYAPKTEVENWVTVPDWQVTSSPEVTPTMKSFVRNWLESKPNHVFLSYCLSAHDHKAAAVKATAVLAESIDLMKLANLYSVLELSHQAVTHPVSNPERAGLAGIRENIDGAPSTHYIKVDSLKEKTAAVLQNKQVEESTKEKIRSAIRYLRFGLDANDPMQAYLNYWIGLEYLFANLGDSKFARIKEIFPALQTLIYFKRNVEDFHRSLTRTKQGKRITGFSENSVNCLLAEECLVSVRDDIYLQFPLLSYRAWKLRTRIRNEAPKKGMRAYHQRHRQNLEWHLARIYRIRNEIVHEASYRSASPILTSNLRYYLTFVLNLTIGYFSQSRVEATSIEEYFALQQLRLASMESEGFPAEKLLSLPHEIDLIV